jgi:hypothetical protein
MKLDTCRPLFRLQSGVAGHRILPMHFSSQHDHKNERAACTREQPRLNCTRKMALWPGLVH